MRAMVISGGGSKGAFAGGVAEYLLNTMGYKYDLFVGTSTGSLLIPHLALDKVSKIKHIFTHAGHCDIFDTYPFKVRTDRQGNRYTRINHFNVLKSFLQGKKTFGGSCNLRKLIENSFTEEEFLQLQTMDIDVCTTVSNLSVNRIEYKYLKDFTYSDFCDWIWASANYVPFMSLVEKNGYEYADGGFGCMVPLEAAIEHGATIIDVIVLETEVNERNQLPSKNVFSLLSNLYFYMTERIERQNIRVGKLSAVNRNVDLNFYYTPTDLTANSLVFESELMVQWWQMGFDYAKFRNVNCNEIRKDD